MTQEYFEPTLFIREGRKTKVDLSKTPFFGIVHGLPNYVTTPPKGFKLVELAKRASSQHLRREYAVSAAHTQSPEPKYGENTRLTIDGSELGYEPMWATRKTAAAFGMLLVEEGQYARMDGPELQLI